MPMATSESLCANNENTQQQQATKKLLWKVVAVSAGDEARPSAREGHCSCVVGNSLYIFGGVSIGAQDDVHEMDDLWRYDMEEKRWSLVKCSAQSEKPLSRAAAAMVSVGSKLYLFGGLNQSVGWLDDLFVYDTETARWTEEDEFTGTQPSLRDKLTAAVIGQNIWFFGGFGPQSSGRGPLDLEDEEDLSSDDEIQRLESQQQAAQFGWFDDLHVYNTQTKAWFQPLQLSMGKPSPRCASTMVAHNQNLVIFGGRDADGRLNDTHLFDTESKKWLKDREIKGTVPDCRSFHAATLVHPDTMVVTGGRGADNQHFDDVYTLNLGSSVWTKHGSTGLTRRGCHTMDTVGDSIVIFGGSNSFNQTVQHCDTFHGDLLVTAFSTDGDAGGSPSKLRKLE